MRFKSFHFLPSSFQALIIFYCPKEVVRTIGCNLFPDTHRSKQAEQAKQAKQVEQAEQARQARYAWQAKQEER